MSRTHLLRVLVAALAVVSGAVFLFLVNNDHTITLTDEGFSPAELHIHAGDTVTFKNNRSVPFWPASDLHPTHTLYPAFDAKKPVPASSSWSFTFTEAGVWTYHDHTAPAYEGIIFVEADARIRDQKMDAGSNCTYANTHERLTCWNDALKAAYDKGGLRASFDLYEALFKTEPLFAQECHSFTHTIGRKSFQEYIERGDFDVTKQIQDCSFGYFHGFMEALVQYSGDYAGARDFCDIVDGKIGKETYVYTACLHGIGHGVTDGYDPTRTDALSIVEPGLDLCRAIGKTPYEVKICATGVFNSLAGLYQNGAVLFDKEDPLAVCYNFTDERDIQSACFDDMKTLLSELAGHHFVEAAKFIERIDDDELAQAAIDNLATYQVYWLLDKGHEQGVKDCYLIEERLQSACVRGISVGFMGQGKPGEEYKEAIATCLSPLVKDEHREECFDRTMLYAQERYTKEEHAALCETLKDVYTGYGCTTYRSDDIR